MLTQHVQKSSSAQQVNQQTNQHTDKDTNKSVRTARASHKGDVQKSTGYDAKQP